MEDLPLTTCQGRVLDTFLELPYATVTQITRRWYAPTSEKAVSAAAKHLGEAGYLARTKRMHRPMQKVYFLKPRGHKLLEAYGRDLPHPPKSIPSHWIYQEHTLSINDVYLAAQELPGQDSDVRVLMNGHEHFLKRNPVLVTMPNGTESRYTPDNWIVLERQGQIRPVIVEIDKGTEDDVQWREKIRRIIAGAEAIRQHYGVDGFTVAVPASTLEPEKATSRCEELMERTHRELKELNREAWGRIFRFTAADASLTRGVDYFTEPLWAGLDGAMHRLTT